MKTAFISLIVVWLITPHISLAETKDAPFIPPRPQNVLGDWDKDMQLLTKYPMMLVRPQLNQLVVRLAREPDRVAWSEDWERTKQTLTPIPRCTPFILEHASGPIVAGGINLASDSIAQLSLTVEEGRRFLLSARPSTWSGSPCFQVRDASFVVNYEPGKSNKVLYSIRNMQVTLLACALDRQRKVATDAQLLEIAERFNRLFQDTSKLELKQPKEGELALALVESKGNTAAIAWSATGSLEGHWVRVDTTAGELSMDAQNPGRVKLTAIPEKGATLTCYAVSPDGKEWLKSELKVPGPPAK